MVSGRGRAPYGANRPSEMAVPLRILQSMALQCTMQPFQSNCPDFAHFWSKPDNLVLTGINRNFLQEN